MCLCNPFGDMQHGLCNQILSYDNPVLNAILQCFPIQNCFVKSKVITCLVWQVQSWLSSYLNLSLDNLVLLVVQYEYHTSFRIRSLAALTGLFPLV